MRWLEAPLWQGNWPSTRGLHCDREHTVMQLEGTPLKDMIDKY